MPSFVMKRETTGVLEPPVTDKPAFEVDRLFGSLEFGFAKAETDETLGGAAFTAEFLSSRRRAMASASGMCCCATWALYEEVGGCCCCWYCCGAEVGAG